MISSGENKLAKLFPLIVIYQASTFVNFQRIEKRDELYVWNQNVCL